MHDYGALKHLEIILRKGSKKRENGGDESNWGILFSYPEMSKTKPPIHLLIANKNVFQKVLKGTQPHFELSKFLNNLKLSSGDLAYS
jgi:hypothetical protein